MTPEPTSTSRIVDYLVLSAPTDYELSGAVLHHAKKGFHPQGSLAVTEILKDGSFMFYQAMVKYEEEGE